MNKDPRFNTTILADGIFTHPEYKHKNGNPANRDVCLLRSDIDLLNPPIWTDELRNYCRKMRCTRIACIDKTPTNTEAKAGSQCWIAGWGSTSRLDRGNSPKLLQSSLNLLSNKYCLENARDLVKSRLHEDEVCAGHPVGT